MTLCIQDAKVGLGNSIALSRGFFIPVAGTDVILSYSQSSVVKNTKIVLRSNHALSSSFFKPMAGADIVLRHTMAFVI